MNCACSQCLPLEGGFGRQIHAVKRLGDMHVRWGHGPVDAKCGTCEYLAEYQPGNHKFFKCRVFGVTGSEASDWRKKWEACGRYKTGGA